MLLSQEDMEAVLRWFTAYEREVEKVNLIDFRSISLDSDKALLVRLFGSDESLRNMLDKRK